jgi:predicted sugar kinase
MNWKINFIERVKSSGFVVQVIWECSDDQDGYVGRLTGSVGFDIDEPKVPFEQVTQPMVVQWVKDTLGENEVNRIESDVAKMISDNKLADRVVGLPWVS